MAKKKAKKAAAKPKPKKKTHADVVNDLVAEITEDPEQAQVLGSDSSRAKVRGVISTQSMELDDALGRGGIPLGRISIIHGKEGCGKTTLCLHLVASVQAQGGICVYVDKEYKLDPDYAQNIGVDTKKLIIAQPSHLEAVYEFIAKVLAKVKLIREVSKERVPVLIVLDSINACIAKAQLEGAMEDKHYAPQAGVHSRCIPKVLADISKEDVAFVMIAQNRTQIGKMFGDPDDIAGGNAPKYYSSVIIKLTRVANNDDNTAQHVSAYIRKNQVAAPFKKCEFWIRHGVGIDQDATIIAHAEKMGVIGRTLAKSGKKTSWFEFPVGSDDKFANGAEQARLELKLDPELRAAILEALALKTKEALALKEAK